MRGYMRTAIIGAGALGSVLGALLTEGGCETTLVERNPAEVEHVLKNGLQVGGVSGERNVKVAITADPHDAWPADIVLTLVKAYDTRGAVDAVSKALAPNGIALTLQNGVGNYEILEAAFPGRCLLGTTTVGAMTLGPGSVVHTGLGNTHVGEPGGELTERARRLAEHLQKMNAGPVHVTDNAMGTVWSKLMINAAINAPGALLRVRNGDLPSSEAGRALIHTIVEESTAIARAKGIRLIFDSPEDMVLQVCEGTARNLNSMFQDIIAGRRTEIDFINGALAAEAERLGLNAPVNRALTLCIKALEATAAVRVESI
jgi:2-dehydropantoate 2-reductase